MAEKKKLNVGSKQLERVKLKAAYNYRRRLREQEEEKRFKEALDSGNPFLFEEEAEPVADASFETSEADDDDASKKGKK
jgi:hypothetical protein